MITSIDYNADRTEDAENVQSHAEALDHNVLQKLYEELKREESPVPFSSFIVGFLMFFKKITYFNYWKENHRTAFYKEKVDRGQLLWIILRINYSHFTWYINIINYITWHRTKFNK